MMHVFVQITHAVYPYSSCIRFIFPMKFDIFTSISSRLHTVYNNTNYIRTLLHTFSLSGYEVETDHRVMVLKPVS